MENLPNKMGNFGTDDELRAVVAVLGLGANIPQDAVYPTVIVDADGKPLNGANRYVLHLDKAQLPPVNALLVGDDVRRPELLRGQPHQPLQRRRVEPLKFNDDGSLDVYIQRDSPGKDKESNWLPAAQEDFSLTLRMYWPKEAVLDGSWKPPAVKLAAK